MMMKKKKKKKKKKKMTKDSERASKMKVDVFSWRTRCLDRLRLLERDLLRRVFKGLSDF